MLRISVGIGIASSSFLGWLWRQLQGE